MLNHILKRDNAGPDKNNSDFQLNEWTPLCDLPKRYQEEIVSRSEIIDVAAGNLIFHYNDKDDKDYYLLSGNVELTSGSGGHVEDLKHSGKQALLIIDQHHPRKFNAKAKENCKIFITRRTFHDTLNVSNGSGKQHEIPELEVDEIDFESSGNWMLNVLNAGVFSKLPPDSMQQIFVSMENFNVNKGDVIIHEGAIVNDYYLIQHGQATCTSSSGEERKELFILSGGDTFGGPALISGAPSTVEVKMHSDGMLMRMPKNSFNNLIKKPLLKSCSAEEFKSLVDSDTYILDVREVDQYNISAIKNSTNIAFADLHAAFKSEKTYIVCGESDTQAMMGAFLLAEKTYSVRYLAVSVDEYLVGNAADGFSLQLIKDKETPKTLEVTVDEPPAEDVFEKTNTPSQIQDNPNELNNTDTAEGAGKIAGSMQAMSIKLEKQIRKEFNELYIQKKKELEDEINLRFKKYHMVTAQLIKKKMTELDAHYKPEAETSD